MEDYHILGYWIHKNENGFNIYTSYHITGIFIATVKTILEAEILIKNRLKNREAAI